jgi:hypothetical protein
MDGGWRMGDEEGARDGDGGCDGIQHPRESLSADALFSLQGCHRQLPHHSYSCRRELAAGSDITLPRSLRLQAMSTGLINMDIERTTNQRITCCLSIVPGNFECLAVLGKNSQRRRIPSVFHV